MASAPPPSINLGMTFTRIDEPDGSAWVRIVFQALPLEVGVILPADEAFLTSFTAEYAKCINPPERPQLTVVQGGLIKP